MSTIFRDKPMTNMKSGKRVKYPKEGLEYIFKREIITAFNGKGGQVF